MGTLFEPRTIHHRQIKVRQFIAELTAYEIEMGYGCTWKCDCDGTSICQIGAPTLDAVLNFAAQDFRRHCDRQHV